jgi:hypothetical protein
LDDGVGSEVGLDVDRGELLLSEDVVAVLSSGFGVADCFVEIGVCSEVVELSGAGVVDCFVSLEDCSVAVELSGAGAEDCFEVGDCSVVVELSGVDGWLSMVLFSIAELFSEVTTLLDIDRVVSCVDGVTACVVGVWT